jgi:hypothetical protein
MEAEGRRLAKLRQDEEKLRTECPFTPNLNLTQSTDNFVGKRFDVPLGFSRVGSR